MSVTVTALSENISENSALEADFGLSLHISVNGRSIMLDAGSTGTCLENAKKLGIDLSSLDAIVLSHGHFDHTDGILCLIENGISNIPLYFNRYMFSERYWYKKDDENYYFPTMSGLSPQYLKRMRVPFMGVCDSIFQLFDGVYILSNIERTCPFEEICPDDVIKSGNEFITDDYRDECVVALDDGDGLIILTGCGRDGKKLLEEAMKNTSDIKSQKIDFILSCEMEQSGISTSPRLDFSLASDQDSAHLNFSMDSLLSSLLFQSFTPVSEDLCKTTREPRQFMPKMRKAAAISKLRCRPMILD